MIQILRALPPHFAATAGTHFRRKQGVQDRVPFRRNLGKTGSERIFNGSPLAGAIRAAVVASGALIDRRIPFVPFDAAPPNLLVTVRPHILRREPLVARRMPLRSEFRVRFRERIGDQHGGNEYPFR